MAAEPAVALTELAFLSATEQAALVARDEVTAVELVELYLERIERLDPELNAFVTVDAEGALAQAHEPRPGPFSGVPLPIKDLTETAGLRTTFSSRVFADYVPERDMAVVGRLRDAGFVLLGKTNTPEFGSTCVTESELNGVCRNPWDTSRTPGGSSGGAASAVAAGLAPAAHGSDGGGSIRIPASCCGLFGLKPARGRISAAPYGDVLAGLATRADHALGARRGSDARRDGRLRAGRSALGAAARAAVSGRGRRAAGAASRRARAGAARRRAGRSCVRRRGACCRGVPGGARARRARSVAGLAR